MWRGILSRAYSLMDTNRGSRETVAKVLLRVSMDHGSYGKTWDVMDGDDDVDSAVKKAIESKADSWHE
jgi:hypothetical protein